MEIRVIEHGRRWIIVKNPHIVDTSGTGGGRSRKVNRNIEAFEGCWTGSRWALQVHFAQVFGSQDDAKFEVMLKRRAMEQNP
jgi:hypothetical protein